MTVDQIREIKKILWNKGLEGCALMKTAENRGRNRGLKFYNFKSNRKPWISWMFSFSKKLASSLKHCQSSGICTENAQKIFETKRLELSTI